MDIWNSDDVLHALQAARLSMRLSVGQCLPVLASSTELVAYARGYEAALATIAANAGLPFAVEVPAQRPQGWTVPQVRRAPL